MSELNDCGPVCAPAPRKERAQEIYEQIERFDELEYALNRLIARMGGDIVQEDEKSASPSMSLQMILDNSPDWMAARRDRMLNLVKELNERLF